MFCNQHLITRFLSTTLVALSLAAPCSGFAMPSDDDASDRSFLFFGKKKNKKNTENTDTTSEESRIPKEISQAVLDEPDPFYVQILDFLFMYNKSQTAS